MKRVKNIVDIRDGQYLCWLEEISKNYKNAQIKAATSVNVVMLDFYWQLGKDIAAMRAEAKWGKCSTSCGTIQTYSLGACQVDN